VEKRAMVSGGKRATISLLGAAFGALIVTAAGLVASVRAESPDPDPKAMLKAMSEAIAAEKEIAFAYDATIEVVTTDLQKIQLASSGEVRLSRPDRLRVTRMGGFAEIELIFDGAKLTLVSKNRNKYAEIPSPVKTVDALVDQVRADFNVQVPGADLLLSDSFGHLIDPVTDAKYLGTGVIGGIECDHLAFKTPSVDWEIWIRVGEPPIPCRYVVTSKLVAQSPEYAIQIADWKSGDEAPAESFVFDNTAGAKRVDAGELENFDDVQGPFAEGRTP
jgi:hypothetical protein